MDGYCYRAYGLSFRSELELPELAETKPTPPDVTIRRGVLPRPEGDFPDGWYRAGRDCHMHAWPEVGVFRIEGGREIIVEAAKGASDDLVRHVLLGAIMGPLLLQRSMLPLHGSTLQIGKRAFAFCAASGEGKSTLAATLHARGHTLVSDDVLGVPWGGDHDEIRVPFAIPRLKLLPDTAENLGYEHQSLPKVHEGEEKRALAASPLDSSTESVPLGGIFLLEYADSLEIVPVDPRVAVLHIMQQTFKPDVVIRTIGGDEHMKICAAIATRVPLFRLRRPRDLSRLGDVVDMLTNHCLRVAA